MNKPIYEDYHRRYLDTDSITEAERMVDDDRLRFQLAITDWFKQLSKKEQRKARKDDTVWPYLIEPLI